MTVDEVFRICLRLGELMLSEGAETYRVEETMARVAKACGVREVESFVTPTGIFLSLEGRTQIRRVFSRSINLDKVSRGNRLSRQLETGEIAVAQLPCLLEELARLSFPYHAIKEEVPILSLHPRTLREGKGDTEYLRVLQFEYADHWM